MKKTHIRIVRMIDEETAGTFERVINVLDVDAVRADRPDIARVANDEQSAIPAATAPLESGLVRVL